MGKLDFIFRPKRYYTESKIFVVWSCINNSIGLLFIIGCIINVIQYYFKLDSYLGAYIIVISIPLMFLETITFPIILLIKYRKEKRKNTEEIIDVDWIELKSEKSIGYGL